jgi:uncharacterized repeat protein (TIGR02543 family)
MDDIKCRVILISCLYVIYKVVYILSMSAFWIAIVHRCCFAIIFLTSAISTIIMTIKCKSKSRAGLLFFLLTSITFSNAFGQNQVVYWIGQTDLVGATIQCNVNNYYGNNIGFTWTDNLPAATQVLSVQVEYNIGVSCTNPNTLTPTLNAVNQTSVTYTGDCSCSPATQTYITHSLNAANYNVNGSNTYILQGSSTTGFNNQPASLNGNFAKVTITYGADDDAGIEAINLLPSFCAQVQNISVELKNFGTNNINSVDIQWEINGTPQTPVSYTTTLAPNASATVVLATNFNFTNGQYIIAARTINPNNTTDGNTSNDELQRTINVGAFPPTGISHTEVTPNDIYTISWVGDNSQTYDLEYGAFGFSTGSGTLISNITGTSQNISGLNPSMNGYDVYVRSYCGATPSSWSTPYSFGVVPFYVSNETELDAAIAAAINGDLIVFLNDIVITTQKTITGKTIIINGQGFELSVPRPGLDDMGRFNSNPSGFRVLQLSSAANVTINNLTIKGGMPNANGGAILVNSGTTLHINNSVVSNTNAGASNGGGGIAISGTMFMKNSFVRRNAARFGGGILVTGTGRAYIEESTMVENRSTATNGGGGAAECQSGSVLYFNNSTLSNNQSTEIGGAINNFNGTVYFINSSATGNVAFGGFNGGAIGNNGGNVFILNSLFAHNYRRTSGDVNNPTGFVLDDFQPHSNAAGIRLLHSIHQANLPAGLGVNTGNIQYTGTANGSDNSIFSGGLLSKITDNNGNEIGEQVYRPFLFNNQGSVAPTLQVGSFVSQSTNLGVPTRFSNNNNNSPAIAYFSSGTWTNLLGTSSAGQEVLSDQVGETRSSTTPARGAIEGEVNATLYIVKVNGASGGTVNGGTIYGDVYPSGSSVTLTAIPNNGQQFVQWNYVAGGTGTASTANPYTFTVTQDVTLIPVFSSLPAGSYTITYIGNGHTGGTVPAGGTFSSATTIAAAGTMERSGFTFTGWNTNSNGSGTAYAPGDNYSAATNLTLYARWQVLAVREWIGAGNASWNNSNNWNPSSVPGHNDPVIISANAQNHLILDQSRTVSDITFNAADKKIVLGNYNLTVSGAITGANANNYIETSGTGQVVRDIPNSTGFSFPIGYSGFNPVTITNNTGTSDQFSVRVIDDVFSNGLSGTSVTAPHVKVTWDIDKQNPNAGSGIDMVFQWDENAQEVGSLSAYKLNHYNGVQWEFAAGVSGTASGSPKTLTHTGYTGTFSPFAVGSDDSPLPVELIVFNGTCNTMEHVLNWTTASEINNFRFVVERSADGVEFVPVGEQAGAGTTAELNAYTFRTSAPSRNEYFYRLIQEDFDGTFKVYPTLALSCKGDIAHGLVANVFPNPSAGNSSLQISSSRSRTVWVQISDAMGRPVHTKELNISEGANLFGLPGATLSAGVYTISLRSEGETHTLKWVRN